MPQETNNAGDGLFAEQGSQEFSSMLDHGQSGSGGETEQGQSLGSSQTSTQQQGGNQQEGTTQQGQNQTQQGQTSTQTQQGQSQTQAQTQPTPDLSEIIKTTVEATAGALRQPQQAIQQVQQREMTPQEFDAKYGIIRPNEETIQQLLGQDPKKAAQALDRITNGNITAAMRLANDIIEAKLSQLQTKLDPHIKSWTEYQATTRSKELESLFFAHFASHSDPLSK